MLTITTQDVLTKSWIELNPDEIKYCIYLIRDKDAVLYIGRSQNPIERLEQHFGNHNYFSGKSNIGWYYRKYRSLAVSWAIDLYTVEECRTRLKDFLLQKGYILDRVDMQISEMVMIEYFHPSLNIHNNPNPSRLPKQYDHPLFQLKPGATDNLY